jgi:hypothetical protein
MQRIKLPECEVYRSSESNYEVLDVILKHSGKFTFYIIVYNAFFPMALQSLNDLGRLTYRKFLELFRHMVGLLG